MGYFLEVEYNSFWQAERQHFWPYKVLILAQCNVCLDIHLHMYHGLKKICCCSKLKKVITTEIVFQFHFYSQYIITMIYNLSTNISFKTFSYWEKKKENTHVYFLKGSSDMRIRKYLCDMEKRQSISFAYQFLLIYFFWVSVFTHLFFITILSMIRIFYIMNKVYG